MQTKPLVIGIFVLVSFYQTAGQDRVAKYPVRLCHYYDNYALLNPAMTGLKSEFELNTGYQQLMGNFSKVATYYFNFNGRLTKQQSDNGPFSVIGIRIFNDREGKYLNRTRGYINYSWHANLTRKLKFTIGLEIGGMNYSVKGTPLSGDGSDMKPDASVGLGIYNSSFHVGVSMSQLFESEVQPLDEVTILYPFLNITADRKINILEDLELIPSAAVRVLTTERDIQYDLNIAALLKKRIIFNSGLHNNDKLVFGIGINDLVIMKGKTNIHISYGFPISRSTLNYSFGEIGIGFYF